LGVDIRPGRLIYRGMNTQSTIWFVVADGAKARILTEEAGHFRTIHHLDDSGHGEIEDSALQGEHQRKAPHADPKQELKHQFARTVADYLNHAAAGGRVDQIVLAAAPHVLHDIREGLNKEVAGKVIRSLSKDYTNIPDAQLPEQLKG
jgi:protein required for attachment to host cells